MRRAILAALVPLAVAPGAAPALAAADPQPVQPFVPGIDDDPELSAAWQRWESKDIDDYVITVRRSCFCVPEKAVRTVIRDDRTVRVTQSGQRLRPGRGYSMDELFRLLRDARVEADSVEVDHTRRGIPRSIAIDPSQQVADDETYLSVTLTRLD